MNHYIESNLNQNEKISEEFRQLAHESFDRIFQMLGKNNFIRWIDRQALSEQIKELVIEAMSEEDIDRYPNWAGYYTRGTNRIKLRPIENNEELRDINTHETFHFITDGKTVFNTFLDEGLTEYLKGMSENGSNTYRENVDVVALLHKVLGDSTIKAYLMGDRRNFDNRFASLLNNSDQNSQEINQFYDNLQKYHNYNYIEGYIRSGKLHGSLTEEEIENAELKLKNAKNQYEQARPQILDMLQKIVVGRIRELSQNLEFYKNGKFDAELANDTISDLIKSADIPGFRKGNSFFEHTKWEEETRKLAVTQVIENSHLLENYEGAEKEVRRNELINTFLPKVEYKTDPRGNQSISTIPSHVKNDNPLFANEDNNIPQKIFSTFFKDKELEISDYIKMLTTIKSTFPMEDSQFETLMTLYNIEVLGNKVTKFKNFNSAFLTNFEKMRKLNEMQEDRKKNTIDSRFVQIGESGRYIERSDNQMFFVEFDEKGDFSEKRLHIRRKYYLYART